MDFHIITIFPEIFRAFIETSLIGKAVDKQLLSFSLVDLRQYTHDRHRSVDDAPYGGGSGMVMKPAPIYEALEALPPTRRVLLTPGGAPFNQAAASRLAAEDAVTLFCGRYEGMDERVVDQFDEQISLGDFILNGGEVAAMAIIEAVSRLLPGVLGNEESVVEESFSTGLLEYPQYTRPEDFRGKKVPPILLSGDHARIAAWRHGQSLLRTRQRRPELFAELELTEREQKLLAELEAEQANHAPEKPADEK